MGEFLQSKRRACTNARIDLVFDDPIPADKVTAKVLQDKVLEMRGDKK